MTPTRKQRDSAMKITRKLARINKLWWLPYIPEEKAVEELIDRARALLKSRRNKKGK